MSQALLEYRLLKTILKSYNISMNDYMKMLIEQQEEIQNSTPVDIIHSILGEITTPEKIEEILQTNDIKEKLSTVSYNSEKKVLMVDGNQVNQLTKSVILLFLIIYYIISNREELSISKSSFIEKAIEILKGTFHSKVLITQSDINIEHLKKIEKLIDSDSLIALLCYSSAILSFNKDKGKISLTHLVKALKSNPEIFAIQVYYLLLQLKKVIKNVYLDSLPDFVYLELFGSGISEIPLPVLKAKLTEPNSDQVADSNIEPESSNNESNNESGDLFDSNNEDNNKNNKNNNKQQNNNKQNNKNNQQQNKNADEGSGDLFKLLDL